jgi:hypothetical protein
MSSRNVVDTQLLTVRQVNALNPDSTVIPAQRILTTDGAGGTYWGTPTAFAATPSLNEIVINGNSLVADSPYNRIQLLTGPGLGTSASASSKIVTLYSECFQTIQVAGGNTIQSSSNSPTVTFVGCNGITITSDSSVNKIYIQGNGQMGVGTGTGTGSRNAYSQINVISNATAIDNRSILSATTPSQLLTVAGVGDILLSTNVTSNAYYISISSFTSKGYHDLSGVAYGTFSSCLSTVSTLFTSVTALVSTAGSLGSNIQRATNQMTGYTTLDLYKYTSTATSQKLAGVNNFASSINISQHRGLLKGILDTAAQTYTVSSATFRLDSMSSIITKKGQVQITHAPSLAFSNNFTVPADTLLYVSSFITCGNSQNTMLSTTFVRPWVLRGGSIINLYSDSLKFILPIPLINNPGLNSNYSITHRIDNFNLTPNNGWGAMPEAQALVSEDNTLSLFISGTSS